MIRISLWRGYSPCWNIQVVIPVVYRDFHGRSWEVGYLRLYLFIAFFIFLLPWWWNWSHIII